MNIIILDIPRVYTGIAEWMACMLYIMLLRPRFRPKHLIPISAAALLIQCGFLVVTDGVSTAWWIAFMGVAVAMMMGMILLMGDVNFRMAAYTGVRAFLLAEFIAALEWQIHSYLWPTGTDPSWITWELMLLIYCGVCLTIALLERACIPDRPELSISVNELCTVILIAIGIFAVSNMSFYLKRSPFSSQYSSEIMTIRTLVDLSGVAIIFAYHIQRAQIQSARELNALQTVLENQYAQYQMSQYSIDLINMKYHDLKHQIAALRAEKDPAIRDRWLDEMEEDISAYEAHNTTGNSVLDTVLTAKSLQCRKDGIAFSAVADGSCLSGIDIMDICTIFGNAMDNAIECERKIPDPAQRMIHLHLAAQKQFILLRVENYCPAPPPFHDGLPITTKGDRENHGFGLKSIRHTARKYGGSMTITTKDDWFVLKILIPNPQ